MSRPLPPRMLRHVSEPLRPSMVAGPLRMMEPRTLILSRSPLNRRTPFVRVRSPLTMLPMVKPTVAVLLPFVMVACAMLSALLSNSEPEIVVSVVPSWVQVTPLSVVVPLRTAFAERLKAPPEDGMLRMVPEPMVRTPLQSSVHAVLPPTVPVPAVVRVPPIVTVEVLGTMLPVPAVVEALPEAVVRA